MTLMHFPYGEKDDPVSHVVVFVCLRADWCVLQVENLMVKRDYVFYNLSAKKELQFQFCSSDCKEENL